ncbi:MAG: hypothetical protein QXU18_08435 [Thermoplasmatales archaeon]
MKNQATMYKDGWNLSGREDQPLIIRLKRAFREKRLILSVIGYIKNRLKFLTIQVAHHLFAFSTDGIKYRYFTHKNNAVDGERTVEIPWVLSLLDSGKTILEIGNVLSHYVNIPHTIVDKYERLPGVINEDAEYFRTDSTYDFIVTISTLEHIGYDEENKDPFKIQRVIENLKSLIKEGGKMIITVPLVYNPAIDEIIKNNSQSFSKKIFMKRISTFNLWKQCAMDEAMKLTYGSKYPFANSVAFLVYEKQHT